MHHHYFTIEQRKTLEKLVGSAIGVGTRLDAALTRLHQPDYGVCIECGKDIEFVLLEADPLAMHCRSCSRLPVPPGP
jgi:RNA polymerase-binding transcription factor DksA